MIYCCYTATNGYNSNESIIHTHLLADANKQDAERALKEFTLALISESFQSIPSAPDQGHTLETRPYHRQSC